MQRRVLPIRRVGYDAASSQPEKLAAAYYVLGKKWLNAISRDGSLTRS